MQLKSRALAIIIERQLFRGYYLKTKIRNNYLENIAEKLQLKNDKLKNDKLKNDKLETIN